MAKPNYAYEKRQRDLEKKRKQEEKRQRKTATKDTPSEAPVVETELQGSVPTSGATNLEN